MRYFVVFPNGQRFGPADMQTLQLWVAENRVGPATILMEESTGRTLPAMQLPALGLSPQPGQQQFTDYYRPYPAPYVARQQSNTETVLAWVFGGLGLVLCFSTCGLFNIVGLILAAVGMGKKQRGATAALVFNIIVFALHFILPMLAVGLGGF